MKQTPYTTYRPVYTQETYQVPVTYTTQVAAAPMAPATGCSTCSGYAPAQVYTAPIGQIQAPVGTLAPTQQYYQQTPANGGTIYQPTPATGTIPSAADLQPVLDVNPSGTTSTYWPTQIQSQPTAVPIRPLQDPNPEARWNGNSAPQLLDPFNQTTSLPSIQRWDYSPVRLASYEVPERDINHVPAALVQPSQREYVGSVTAPVPTQPRINEGWRKD
jgi:hypothetical protein